MSVTVRHLNADSTFLLLFSHKAEPTPSDLLSANGAYSILIDPWLVGSSIVNAKWFAITNRLVPSSINHLSEIEEPDIVLVSQNKPDHCHKETLLQLKPEGKTLIAAEPGAAKAIKSWNHFDPNRVQALAKYNDRARFGNTLRLRIPPLGSDGRPGEVTIAFLPARNYMTGLHNAFGITYQAPTRVKTVAPVSTIDLPRSNMHMLLTPQTMPYRSPQPMFSPNVARPATSQSTRDLVGQSAHLSTTLQNPEHSQRQRCQPELSTSSNDESSRVLLASDDSDLPPLPHYLQEQPAALPQLSQSIPDVDFDASALIDTTDFASTLPTPVLSPSPSTQSPSSSFSPESTPTTITSPSFAISLPSSPSLAEIQARYSRPPMIRPARPKAISILYTPHGLPLSDIQDYIKSHLVPLPGALPLTCLLHSFDYAKNPWWFGGNIMMGAEGGIQIARTLMARCWISAHDEEKDDRGVAVKLLKCNRNNADMVRDKLASTEKGWDCDVRSLDVGEEILLVANPEQKGVGGDESGNIGLGVELNNASDKRG
ncbi:hypothetical protein LTS08_006577 [Lithohypha guttulata]|uniref:Uncharacterized protein n=1 Tax=Lithohypha guttulata TaxID=1690604 RepID=A0AAN7T119_9EURO|nr:hypothetical protein LTR05_005129 [Lithohypha guttulata]KAK5098444.1 hypothetical protein LTS08_006577 [Lithohypha guttulata]